MAARFTVDPEPQRSPCHLEPRLEVNARLLEEAYRALAGDVHRGGGMAPAAEWILDNYHLVTAEIQDVRRHLPRGYYRGLPKLATRELAGTARVYALALELIRHSDSRLDRPMLVRFVSSFQAVAPLTIGELWAWPSMLRLALIENLRRLAALTLEARSAQRAADAYVERIDAAGGGRLPPLPGHLHATFVVQLLQRIREYGPRLAAVRAAVDEHLADRERSAEDAIRAEHQEQAAAQVSVANVITSLRLCSTLDWSDYFEAVSLVERVLRQDPAGAYPRMDFLSRDRYRQSVEELAGRSGEAQAAGREPCRGERSRGGRGGSRRRSRRTRRPPPGRPRPPGSRGRRRLPAAPEAASAADGVPARDGRLSRRHRRGDRRGDRHRRRLRCRRRGLSGGRGRGGPAAAAAGERARCRAGTAPGGEALAAAPAAAPRPAGRRAGGAPDAGRGADAAELGRGRPRARRARRGARPRQPRPARPLRDPR